MVKMKSIMQMLSCAVLLSLASQVFAVAKIKDDNRLADPFPNVARAYAVLADDQWLWGKDIDRPLPQASLTKLMTALLVAESANLDQFAVVSAHAAAAKPFHIHLKVGDKIRVRDLLTGMLISSANDACLALAEHVGKTESLFVAQMNARAKALGLHNTHFENACGFDEDGHQSSVRDLVTLTHAALSQKVIAESVKQDKYILPRVGKKGIKLESTNALLGKKGNGVVGVKTGFTNGAGRCLIALSQRGQHSVLLVFLNSRNRWWNAAALLEKAFDHVERQS